MKILLSAYACEPGVGSEPGKGWNMAREMANHHEVWVLTWSRRRPSIEVEMTRNPVPNLHFIYCGFPGDLLWRKGLGIYPHYYLWQLKVYFLARRLHREVNFDLAHHMVYATYKMPSFLALLPIPLVWGPVGGGESAPKTFWKDFSWRGKIYEVARDLVRSLGELDPFVRLTVRRSALFLASTQDTAERLQNLGVKEVRVFSQVGSPQAEINRLAQVGLPESNPVRFISIGRLLHWKGFHLGLRAFALAKLELAEYWIVGEGPELQHLRRLAQELGIAHQVKFWGKLPRNETLHKLAECHVLVHPSLHESGGLVCLEAMITARPVICLELGGPAIQVTEETGCKVPALTPEQVVSDLAKVMTSLAVDPQLRLRLGQAAQRRGSEVFSWDVKSKFFNQLYQEILAQQ